MIPKRYIIFHAIPVITIPAIVGIGFSGIDSGGDFPGLLRVITVVLSFAAWSLVFSASMIVHVVRNKQWVFLFVAAPLLVARVLWTSEILGNDSADTLYVWLPVEYILFYLLIHEDTKLIKLGLLVITATLYGLCCLACATTFKLM